MAITLPTPSDAGDYNQRGAWDPNQVYRKDQTGTPNRAVPDEVEYLGAYWISTGYTVDQAPQISYQGAYTGWTLDTSSGAPTPNYYPAVPEAPTGLSAGYTSSNEIALFWNRSAVYGEGDVSSYNVYENGKLIATTTSTSFTAKGLTASTGYSFSVSAADSSGSSGTEALVTSSGVNENPYPNANPTLKAYTTAAATNSSGKYFSPYMDMTLPQTNLESIAEGSKLRDFTLAFMSTDDSEFVTGTTGPNGTGNTTWTLNQGVVPTMSWGGLAGATTTSTGAIIQQVKDVEAEGGVVTVSIGGYTGMDPAVAAAQYMSQLQAGGESGGLATDKAVQNLQSEYQSVLNTYGVHALDFDIENPESVNNTEADHLRDLAIKGLESSNPGLTVSYTVAVTPKGLSTSSAGSSSNDYGVLQEAKKDGVTINTLNIMTMDYGGGAQDMYSAAKSAATYTEAQLTKLGMTSTLIGITPMIGLNDDTAEVFDTSDAKNLAAWASTQSWVAGLGEWQIPRDQAEKSNANPADGAQPTSSGIKEAKNYEFAGLLDQVTVSGGGATGKTDAVAQLVQAAASFNPGGELSSVSSGHMPTAAMGSLLGVSHLRAGTLS